MHTVRSETEDTLQEQSVPRSPHPWKLSLEQRKTLQPDELKLLIDERKDTFEDALALLLETSVDKKTFDEKIKKIKEEMKNIDIYINDIDKTILPDEAKKNLIADKESDRDVWVGNLEAANNELDALMLTDEQLEEAINYYEQRKQQCDGIGKGTDMQESIVRILCKLQDKIIASMDSINDLEQDRNKRKWDQDTKEVFKTEIADHMRVRDQYTKRMFAFAS
jgi:hypothetical protein